MTWCLITGTTFDHGDNLIRKVKYSQGLSHSAENSS